MNVLVVGSSVIDLFLNIEDKSYIKLLNNQLSLNLGDKIPINIQKTTLGGNGANVSVGLKRLGYNTNFFTYFGNDIFSKEIQEVLKKEDIRLTVEQYEGKSSLSLILNFGHDRIIFSHHEQRHHSFAPPMILTRKDENSNLEYDESKVAELLYLTSIGNEWENAYQKVLEFVKQSNIPLAFTPGAPQFENSSDILFEVIRNTKIILINKEEAEKLLKMKNIIYEDNIKDLLLKLAGLGPKIVSITNGTEGAYSLDEHGNFYKTDSFGGEVIERTGAGDAYTSGFLAAYLSGKEVLQCMRWGTFNAGYVIKKTGAQEGLLTKEEMQKVEEDNKEFQAEKI